MNLGNVGLRSPSGNISACLHLSNVELWYPSRIISARLISAVYSFREHQCMPTSIQCTVELMSPTGNSKSCLHLSNLELWPPSGNISARMHLCSVQLQGTSMHAYIYPMYRRAYVINSVFKSMPASLQ